MTIEEIIKKKVPLIETSEDDMHIDLALPLGSTIWHVHTKCSDACSRNKKTGHIEGNIETVNFTEREKCNIHCDTGATCHTLIYDVKHMTLTLKNLEDVSKGWLVTYFPTKKSALKTTKEMIMERRKILETNGIPWGRDSEQVRHHDYLMGWTKNPDEKGALS